MLFNFFLCTFNRLREGSRDIIPEIYFVLQNIFLHFNYWRESWEKAGRVADDSSRKGKCYAAVTTLA